MALILIKCLSIQTKQGGRIMFNSSYAEDDIKCGDIFLIADGCLMTCEFCGVEYTDFDTLTRHIIDHLLLTRPPLHIKEENVSDNEDQPDDAAGAPIIQYHIYNIDSAPTKLEYDQLETNGETKKNPLYCSLCNRKFRYLKTRLDHQNIHDGQQPHMCPVCFKTFYTLSSLKSHSRVHKGKEQEICSACGKSFSNKSSLTIHIREKHLPDTDPRSVFVCKICGSQFRTASKMHLHFIKHKIDTTTTYTCDYCQKDYKTRRLISQHMYHVHSGQKAYKCSFCSKIFRHKVQRVDHENVHTGQRPYQCQYCPKSFLNRRSVRRHNCVRQNGEEKPLAPPNEIQITNSEPPKVFELDPTVESKNAFECNICFKTFGRKKNRDEHLNVHSGQKPFQCTLCTKKFTGSSNLTTHYKRQHGNIGLAALIPKVEIADSSDSESHPTEDSSSTFECSKLCPEKFMAATSMEAHNKKRYGGLVAEDTVSKIDIQFTNPIQPIDSKLNALKNTKTTYECSICFKKFGRSKARDEHVSIHSGKRPFQCDLCPKNFVRSSTLRTHMQKNHAHNEMDISTNEVEIVDSAQPAILDLNPCTST